MNRSIYFLGLLFLICAACEKKINSDKKAISYAVGQQLGKNLLDQEYEYDADTLAESLKATLKGKPSKMADAELQAALVKLQQGVMKKQGEVAIENKADADKFLEKNKTQANIKTTSSGLQYSIEKIGTGKTPSPTDIVKVHYKGSLITGEPFDNSYQNGKTEQLPVSAVIKGWGEALQMMKEGSKLKLFIPPELAYGSTARPGIPANSVLVFDFELLSVVERKESRLK